MSSNLYVFVGKPLADRGVAALVLIALSPLLLLAAALVKLESRGPVLFRQRRVGLEERVFEIVKFRTMTVDPERAITQTFGASPGVTRVGRVLRRCKIDELPQLLNVITGDMSLVGPRPCLPELLESITPWARARFAVRPGLTGLAQVNGNVHIDWHDRWAWDLRYVETLSLRTDLAILGRTVLVLVFGERRFRRAPPPPGHRMR